MTAKRVREQKETINKSTSVIIAMRSMGSKTRSFILPQRSIEENERTSGSLRNKILDSYLLFVLGASDGHSLWHHIDGEDDLSDTGAS